MLSLFAEPLSSPVAKSSSVGANGATLSMVTFKAVALDAPVLPAKSITRACKALVPAVMAVVKVTSMYPSSKLCSVTRVKP